MTDPARIALDAGLRIFEVQTFNGVRDWYADDAAHALEQHDEAFGGDPGEIVIDWKDKTAKRTHELRKRGE